MSTDKKAVVVLEDGTVFHGRAFGVEGEKVGAVILNTGVVGYQEMMTDTANVGEILVLTYPLIGNYGVAPKFNESKKVWLSGLVIKEKSHIYSNWQARQSFDDFIKEHNLVTISEVDTRTLAVHLREKGEMLGIISTQIFQPKEFLSKLDKFRKEKTMSYLPKISVNKPLFLGNKRAKIKITVLDLGITNSIIRQLENLGFSISLLPYNTKPQDILQLKPQGLIISNGPEEDIGLREVVSNVKALINRLPILGISTGHQVLARALGAKAVKMKLGHHGLNYPVQNPISYKGEITVQNHSYVVDAKSVKGIKDVKITGYNLNDHTVEEVESKKLRIIGVQYYPVSPGFDEVHPVFKRFLKMIEVNS